VATSIIPLADTGALYLHVRVLLGMIVGLGLTHLLRHVARIVDHPRQTRTYWVHLVWVLFVFVYLLHFWWWEFRLSALAEWSFAVYLFVVLYALLLYLLCAFILPDSLDGYAGYREYFYSRRRWIFGALAAVYVVDFADTWIKGTAYLESLGPEYPIRTLAYIAACLVAIWTARPAFHATFAIAALVYQLSWIARQYELI
jgi:hypothetical protein